MFASAVFRVKVGDATPVDEDTVMADFSGRSAVPDRMIAADTNGETVLVRNDLPRRVHRLFLRGAALPRTTDQFSGLSIRNWFTRAAASAP
jgi:hypothetical protein